jgi:uncharacterized membrane protein
VLEGFYRQRLEADLARWQSEGVIAPSVGEAIRAALPPPPKGVTLATVVGIVGGLLIAAAFLTFVAANWSAIARPARFVILLAGITFAFGLGAAFDRRGRPHLADLGVAVGSIIFGAAIALVGQMYHLGPDFTGGLLLWALGALAAAVLTSSRGALAVALVAACIWSGASVNSPADVPHLPFVGFWLVCAALAVAWNASAARHLVALAALTWWMISAVGYSADGWFVVGAGSSFLLGAGLLLARVEPDALGALGRVLSIYAAFSMAAAAAAIPFMLGSSTHPRLETWALGCAWAGLSFAVAATAMTRQAATALATVSIGLILIAYAGVLPADEPWLAYALALLSMLCLLVSGVLDDQRPRVVAGWIGIAFVIAAITWMVESSLLYRAAFFAIAGVAVVAIAIGLGRLRRAERR